MNPRLSPRSNLPHRFPFRLVDRVEGGRGLVRLTAGAPWNRGSTPLPIGWLVEAAAQAAALALAPPSGQAPSELLLAAIEGAALERPPRPGETVEIAPRLEARFGRLIRVRATLYADGIEIGNVGLLLTAR